MYRGFVNGDKRPPHLLSANLMARICDTITDKAGHHTYIRIRAHADALCVCFIRPNTLHLHLHLEYAETFRYNADRECRYRTLRSNKQTELPRAQFVNFSGGRRGKWSYFGDFDEDTDRRIRRNFRLESANWKIFLRFEFWNVLFSAV